MLSEGNGWVAGLTPIKLLDAEQGFEGVGFGMRYYVGWLTPLGEGKLL